MSGHKHARSTNVSSSKAVQICRVSIAARRALLALAASSGSSVQDDDAAPYKPEPLAHTVPSSVTVTPAAPAMAFATCRLEAYSDFQAYC
jgi:hypothetical protein